MNPKYTTQEYAGRKYNYLTVVEIIKSSPPKYETKFRCLCDCGKETVQRAPNVIYGRVRSCGCKRAKHGKSHTKVNRAYYGIFERVDAKPGTRYWKNYVLRGITVCDRWRESFQNFYEDMGDPPSRNHSLDRIDNNGNYEPSNCRWSTKSEQSNNTRRNYLVNYQGRTLTIAQLAKEKNMEYSLLYNRFYKYGWDVERAVTQPSSRSKHS